MIHFLTQRQQKSDFAALVRLRMAQDRNPLLPVLADKLAVKPWAADRSVASGQVYWSGVRGADVPWDDLPDRYFLKANHGSQWNLEVLAGRITVFGDGSQPPAQRTELTREEAESLLDGWLVQVYRPAQWAYLPIPPRIFAEEVVDDRVASELQDYRFYVFDGRVAAANLGSPSLRRAGRAAFWYADGTPARLTRGRDKVDVLPVPETWSRMIQTAETLGRGIDFVRVDLYDTPQGVLLGEMTFYPQAGMKGSPTSCPVFNRWLGKQWKAPWLYR